MEEGPMSIMFSGICCYASADIAANQVAQTPITEEISVLSCKLRNTRGVNVAIGSRRPIVVNAINCANASKYCLLAGEPDID